MTSSTDPELVAKYFLTLESLSDNSEQKPHVQHPADRYGRDRMQSPDEDYRDQLDLLADAGTGDVSWDTAERLEQGFV